MNKQCKNCDTDLILSKNISENLDNLHLENCDRKLAYQKKSNFSNNVDETFIKNLETTKVNKELQQPLMFVLYKTALESQERFSEIKEINLSQSCKTEFLCWIELVKDTLVTILDGNKSYLDAEAVLSIDVMQLTEFIKDDKHFVKSVLLKIILAFIEKGCFLAKSRVYLIKLLSLFNISYQDYLYQIEIPVAIELEKTYIKLNVEKEAQNRNEQTKVNRWITTGIGAVVGGTILAVSGGLAAPLLLPALGGLFGTSALLGGAGGIAVFTTLFGVTGAGITGYKVSRRVAGIEEFEVLSITENMSDNKPQQFHMIVCISGWIKEITDLIDPWQSIEEGDVYALKFETEIMLTIGKALSNLFATGVVGFTANEILKKTVLNGIIGAISWPITLVQLGYLVDNPWSMGLDRAKKAGLILADAISSKLQGNRPITLIGYSLGGIVVFFCLEELKKRAQTDKSLYSIVHDVFILGAPLKTDKQAWLSVKSLVNGRFVNGYCETDWILAFLHRAYSYGKPVSGMVDLNKLWKTNEKIIESINLSDIIDGHLDYLTKMPNVLKRMGIMTDSQS